MAVTRGQEIESSEEVSNVSDIYELPVPTGCRVAATPFCRFVPFMPSYDDLYIAGRLRRLLSRICCRSQPSSNCV